MNFEQLYAFLSWCLVINLVLYALSAIGIIGFPGLIYRIQGKWFDMSKQTMGKILYGYLAAFKLLLIVFCFTPWLALALMR